MIPGAIYIWCCCHLFYAPRCRIGTKKKTRPAAVNPARFVRNICCRESPSRANSGPTNKQELVLLPSPLDALIDALGGPGEVAEMTGRRGRLVRSGGSGGGRGRLKYELRPETEETRCAYTGTYRFRVRPRMPVDRPENHSEVKLLLHSIDAKGNKVCSDKQVRRVVRALQQGGSLESNYVDSPEKMG